MSHPQAGAVSVAASVSGALVGDCVFLKLIQCRAKHSLLLGYSVSDDTVLGRCQVCLCSVCAVKGVAVRKETKLACKYR